MAWSTLMQDHSLSSTLVRSVLSLPLKCSNQYRWLTRQLSCDVVNAHTACSYILALTVTSDQNVNYALLSNQVRFHPSFILVTFISIRQRQYIIFMQSSVIVTMHRSIPAVSSRDKPRALAFCENKNKKANA